MKKHDQTYRRASVATLLGTLCFGVALAGAGKQPTAQKVDTTTASPDAKRAAPVYKPPRRGAPLTRIGGGTRGDDAMVALQVIAPEHTGLTTMAQPTLYWYASRAIDGDVEFVLTERDAIAPVWRHRIEGKFESGIQPFALQEAGLELQPGIDYQWSVAVIHSSGKRARDVVAIGTVERIVDAQLPNPAADPLDRAAQLAANGVWYDAIQVLSEFIGRDAADQVARSYRRDLLEQVGLLDVADAERIAANYQPANL
ncbi:MAG: DUF928 domain-containing protein [Gammaproteobacteria bacterium]